jgi:hypothetical protein
MPLIQLTAPEGALTSEGRATVQRTLARTLLRWEGVPAWITHRWDTRPARRR